MYLWVANRICWQVRCRCVREISCPEPIGKRGFEEMEETESGIGLGERYRACFQMWRCWSVSLELRGDGRSEDDVFRI